jgi:L-threonylcarbamoyladenylate synthase
VRTELLDATSPHKDANRHAIVQAAELLKAGQLVAFPTDTVYGVAAIARSPSAVARLYVAKGRPPDKSIPVLLACAEDLNGVVKDISAVARVLVAHYWPGALTLILPKSNLVPSEISPTHSVAVRVPDLDLTRQIIASAGAPLAVTSANLSGQPSPRTAAAVLNQLGGRIAAVVDGGMCPGGVPSTILDCTVHPPKILRSGAISHQELLRYANVTPLGEIP